MSGNPRGPEAREMHRLLVAEAVAKAEVSHNWEARAYELVQMMANFERISSDCARSRGTERGIRGCPSRAGTAGGGAASPRRPRRLTRLPQGRGRLREGDWPGRLAGPGWLAPTVHGLPRQAVMPAGPNQGRGSRVSTPLACLPDRLAARVVRQPRGGSSSAGLTVTPPRRPTSTPPYRTPGKLGGCQSPSSRQRSRSSGEHRLVR
jgi:hypothetical protein